MKNLYEQLKTSPGHWIPFRCPCPDHLDKSPSTSAYFGKHGLISLKCFRGCASGDVALALVVSDGRFASHFDKSLRACALYQEAKPLADGCLGMRYLAARLGEPPPLIFVNHLRLHPGIYLGSGTFPCLLAPSPGPQNVSSIAATAIDPRTAQKANIEPNKWVLGSPSSPFLIGGRS